jgi:DNA polymerase III subunit beta
LRRPGMHLNIDKEIFLKALARVQGVVEKRNTIPILANVLIEAEHSAIHLTATDLEVGMRASYPATVLNPGRITVSAKKLFEITKELPEKEVSFKSRENCWIEIKCGKSVFNIVGLSAEEFPAFPRGDNTNFLSISTVLLREMIEKTSFAQSTDESKYNLAGIFFKSVEKDNKNYLKMVATDGHRLSLIEKKIASVSLESLKNGVIFPRKGLAELKKIIDETSENIDIGFIDNSAIIKKDQLIIIMRLVDGDFPDYNRVIPKDNSNIAIVKRDIFLHALRRMSILSSEKSRGVKVVLKEGILELSSSNPEFGEAREDMEMQYNGPELSIGFNARYLLDVLNTQESDFIKISIKDNLAPGLITTTLDDGYLAVVMPMRL